MGVGYAVRGDVGCIITISYNMLSVLRVCLPLKREGTDSITRILMLCSKDFCPTLACVQHHVLIPNTDCKWTANT